MGLKLTLCFLLFAIALTSGVNIGSYIPQGSNYYANSPYGNAPNQGLQNNFQYGRPANQGPYAVQGTSYIPNNGNSLASNQFGNFGVSAPRPQTLPVSVPQPVVTSYVPTTSYYPQAQQSIVSAPASNSQWTNSGVIQGGSTVSGLPTSYVPTAAVNSGLSSTYLPSSYTPSTTLGQISNVPYGASVGSSSTSAQVTNSQNQLIQSLPSSPNAVTYQVTSVAQETPPIYFPATVTSQIRATTPPVVTTAKFECSPGFTWNGNACIQIQKAICQNGFTFNGTACILTTALQCSQGVWNGQACISVVQGNCPSGFQWNGVECITTSPLTCPSGYSMVNGNCVITASLTCSQGKWNGTACVTLSPGACPAGSVLNGDQCVTTTNAICPTGTTMINGQCIQRTDPVCSQGTWNGQACIVNK
jgi:hypothetical protein